MGRDRRSGKCKDGFRRPRILLYCHDGLGLGHMRRTIAISAAIARRRPDVSQVAFTSLLQAHAFEIPATLDYVKLPSITKEHLYETDPDRSSGRALPGDVHTVRAAIIEATIDAFAPDLILVDHEPGGLAGELLPVLTNLSTMEWPRPRLVMGLRDITYSPSQTRKAWREDEFYELLDHVYDRILIYGSKEIFDPIQEYGLSQAVAAKTTFTGYIQRLEPVKPATAIRDKLGAQSSPLVVVTVGGGADGVELLRTYLAAVRAGWLSGAISYLVTGPQLPEAEQVELMRAGGELPGVTVVPFCDDLVSYLSAADVVVTMGGYNSLCEAVAANKRPIVVPRKDDLKEQLVRAKRFDALGIATLLRPRDLTADRLGAMVRAELEGGVSPVPVLDFGGLDRIAEALIHELG